MTIQEIQSKVNEQASARFPEVIGRVFSTLVSRHTHDSWRKECFCDYCSYIRNEYVPVKLTLHRIKKQINHLEWHATQMEIHKMDQLYMEEAFEKWKILDMKRKKMDLKKEVL